MTIQTQIALLKRFAAEDDAAAKLLHPDNAMKHWFEGRAKGYSQTAQWLERDVLPHHVSIYNPLCEVMAP